ncbi:MAG: peptidylprolyl isomerase [Phycisphaerales bacterium]
MRMMRQDSRTDVEFGTGLPGPHPDALFEALERREMFYLGPMITSPPPHGLLETPANTVVRVLTNMGAVDIELFDSVAPNTVQNIRNYINQGKTDEAFFDSAAGGMLRFGGFKFYDGAGLSTVTPNAPVANEFNRPNTERTVGLWKPAGQPDGGRGQFYINLQNNPTLDSTNGGHTVFGRVVQGWNVVQAIAGLAKLDLDQALTGSNPNPGTFDSVPVMANYNPNVGPTEATLVRVLDIDAMKPTANGRYYENGYHFPDGFRSASTVERLDLVNLETSLINAYQVIVRYETGERDQVIATGALAPNQRFSLKINDMNLPNYNLVRSGVGYAIEVRSGRALAASINRRDFGVQVGESLVMAPRYAEGAFRNWNFGGSTRAADMRNFLTWQGLKDQNTTVNVGIFSQGGAPKFFQFQLKAFRRGGVALHSLANLPDGPFSIQVSATGPIVAALSTYKIAQNGNPADGSTSQGAINAGGMVGVLAAAKIPTGGTAHLDLVYTAGSPAAISVAFTFILSDGTRLNANPVLLTSASRRARLNIAQMGVALPTDQFFSIRYQVANNAAPVAVQYTSQVAGDTMSTPFQNSATRTVAFGDGYTDPTIAGTGMQETISVFNPYNREVSFFYQLIFHFSDGATVFGPLSSLAAWGRADFRPQDIPAVLAKINAAPAFRFYSVEVASVQFTLPLVNGGVVAQITRVQNSWQQNETSMAGLDARLPVTFLNHPEYSA